MENLLITSGIVGLILILYSVIAFVVARILHDNSVMDVLYGPAFTVASISTMVLTSTYTLLSVLVAGCIGLWATRLFVRIFRKNFGKPEDARYAAWRNQWMKRGRGYFLLRSYLQVNLLQCVLIFFIALPAIIALSFPTSYNAAWLTAGFLVFAFGLAYETIADWQLDAFIQRKIAGTESATLMTQGLFRYCRRPNYFGETLVWWGLTIMVLPLPFGYLAVISPLVITYIVTKITGPMLENMFLEKYPDKYREYIRTTNYFIPGPPRS